MTQTQNEAVQPSPMTRKVKLAAVEQGIEQSIELTEEERKAIMALLDLQDLAGYRLEFKARKGSGKRAVVAGRLRADVVQTCVVSLEPVPAQIDVPVKAEFWPPEKISALQERADDPSQAGELDWPEPIEGDEIDLGPLAYETLATALDPYPKKAGAQFDWSDAKEGPEIAKNSPFAALKGLKNS